eukprot:gene3707-4227_t
MNSIAQVFRQRNTACIIRKLAADAEVIVERLGNAGVITLNRPKALNALNLPMIDQIYPQLLEWDNDNDVKVIIMKGAGDKAFCAGGDVRAIAEAGKVGGSLTKTFFKDEYILNHAIGTLKTPFVALINGITMGGGVGLSVHGKFRVATQKTLFAMPETAIGFFPDVGGGYFLPRLSGHIGTFLALTGNIPTIEDKLLSLDTSSEQTVKDILDEFHEKCFDKAHGFSLESQREKIDRIFAAPTVREIMTNLQEDNSEWSSKQLKLMERMSPLSMCVTLKQLEKGANLSFADVFTMEYRMSQKFMTGKDFYEGIRAVLVDKDNSPSWNPASVDDISEEDTNEYFEPLPENEDLIPSIAKPSSHL